MKTYWRNYIKQIKFLIIYVFLLSTSVISTTGAIAVATPCKANPDTFDLSPSRPFVGNVLSNDQGTGLKVLSTSKTKNGGKAIVYSKGDFYYKPAFCFKTTLKDSFTYTIADKYGHKRTAKVTVNYTKTREGIGIDAGTDVGIDIGTDIGTDTGTYTSTDASTVVKTSKIEQINKAN